MSNQTENNKPSLPKVYKPTAIPLSKDFDYIHAPYSDLDKHNNKTYHLIVGREHIVGNLVALLKSQSRNRGSYLIAGYRGVGKTSIVNRAIEEYEEDKKTLKVHLNLGDKSQLTPLDIYHSIASILRKNLERKGRAESTQNPKELSKKNIKNLILFVSSFIVLIWFTFSEIFGVNLFELTSIEIEKILEKITIFLLLFIIFVLSCLFLKKSSSPECKIRGDLDKLIDRITSEISENESTGFSYYVERIALKNKKKLPVNIREVEEELSWIIGKLSKNGYKVILILDELDKLSDESEISAQKFHPQLSSQEIIKIDLINDLLGSLKSFITTAHATFFFISGRETLDKYYSEKGSPNSLYESLFDRVFEIPSLLTDQGTTSQAVEILKLVEEYVCRRLRGNIPILEKLRWLKTKLNDNFQSERSEINKVDKLIEELSQESIPEEIQKSNEQRAQELFNEIKERFINLSIYYQKEFCDLYYSLKRFHKNSKVKNDDKLINYISKLRDFIYYLAFHSWGNPKRLSSLFETFILPKDLVDKDLKEIWDNKNDASYWLVFNINHLRSFSLAAELTGLFMHQLSREVSSISDKLTVSTFSAIHFILKFHAHGFKRSTLQHMSEAIGIYRSPEFNAILNDLLAHTFNPYIRVVRNGLYRYRFYLGIEQELHYISHVSDLESVTYNSSLDSMKHVKRFYETIIANSDNEETSVRSGSRIALGDICAIEQSYADATVHYNIACNMLLKILKKNDQSVHHDILLQCVEVLLKQGDLEEHKQNFNNAAAIYFEAERIVERLCCRDAQLKKNLRNGSSKWILLKQPFWASHFLSLKQSSYSFEDNLENEAEIKIPDYLYSEDDQNFYHAAASLYFFSGNVELAREHYEKADTKIDNNKINQHENKYDERIAFLKGNVLIGKVENNLLSKSLDYFNFLNEKNEQAEENEQKVSNYFIKLFEFIQKEIIDCNKNSMESLFNKAAANFENNGLYVNATITYLKAISYYTAIMDAFQRKTNFSANKKVSIMGIDINDYLNYFTKKVYHKVIIKNAKNAIRCINKARQLDSGYNNKRLLIFSVDKNENIPTDITQLFEMLLFRKDVDKKIENYPSDEETFWQHSLWAQKLTSLLLWAHYVECKITDCHNDSIFTKLPKQLSSLATRPAILIWWVQARRLSQEFISGKLMKAYINKKTITSTRKILMGYPYTMTLASIDFAQKTKELVTDLNNFLENNSISDCQILKNAYHISRNLYFAHAHSRIISRKNFDLIFPRLPHIYYTQWKLLLNLIITMWVASEQRKFNINKIQLNSIRDYSYLLQRRLVTLDEKVALHERIPPSHFDYEYIHLRLNESLESSINLINNTSNTHKTIFQNKYFCHNDYSDPEFHTDYMLANMFIPSAWLYKKTVTETHEKLYAVIRSNSNNSTT